MESTGTRREKKKINHRTAKEVVQEVGRSERDTKHLCDVERASLKDRGSQPRQTQVLNKKKSVGGNCAKKGQTSHTQREQQKTGVNIKKQ